MFDLLLDREVWVCSRLLQYEPSTRLIKHYETRIEPASWYWDWIGSEEAGNGTSKDSDWDIVCNLRKSCD